MTDDLDSTIRIQRNAKVGTDSRGRTVWTRPVETVELELVSTQMLEQMLDADIEADRARMRALAEGEEGILARDPKDNSFEIVPEDELQAALAAAGEDDRPLRVTSDFTLEAAGSGAAEEPLSLVTTQVLKKRLAVEDDGAPADPAGGYNPYDRG